MNKRDKPKQILSNLFFSALKAINGCIVVEQQLLDTPIEGNVSVLAVGKAAVSMMRGAQNQLKDQIQSALIITKKCDSDDSFNWPCIESGHPIPDKKSLEAGANLLEFISNIPQDSTFLALISGGASALVESLPAKMNLDDLQKINQYLLSSGLEINDMNFIRQRVSSIKAGKALKYLATNEMTQFLISDVKNDDISVIGSGLFVEPKKVDLDFEIPDWLKEYLQAAEPAAVVSVDSKVVANNEIACQAIMTKAIEASYFANYHGQSLYGDVYQLAEKLSEYLLRAEPGIHIWGGEPTIVLPEKTGQGGRCQSLALALACLLDGTEGITVLVGATDGNDGTTDDAGAIIDGFTLQRGKSIGVAKAYLDTANAGEFLAEAGDLLSTGVTGTNVMDIVIALKEPILAAS